jgi:hypothetical protein
MSNVQSLVIKTRMERAMTFATYHRDLVPTLRDEAATTWSNPVAGTVGVLRRIFDAIIEPRQKQADRDIARFLARSGGRLTDNMEREMTRRLLTGGDWNVR